ncbi:MAG: protein-disulfide reductase DsbD family protein [Bryobacteraceae bacterium]|nr:protein-disulfide reductase DsbD family protein [Bryobacteraceae bacterium]
MKDYGVAPSAVPGEVRAKHVLLRTAASTSTVRSGQRIMLSVEVTMAKKLHVYAPGTANYIPVEWKLNEAATYQVFDAVYPPARTLHLAAINESVPVYENKVRLVRDVMIAPDNVIAPVLAKQKELTIEGTLRYQACDERICYPPETVPVKWTLGLEAHDRTRVPADLRRGALK